MPYDPIVSCIKRGLLVFLLLPNFSGCNQSEFRSTPDLGEQPLVEVTTISSADQELARSQGSVYAFQLALANGARTVRQGPSTAQTQIFLDDGKTTMSGAELQQWRVVLNFSDIETPQQALGANAIDFSQVEGQTLVEANFVRQDGRTGRARESIFVDGSPPRVSLIELTTTPAGDMRSLYWSAVDNLLIEPKRTTLYACVEGTPDILVGSFDELSRLPANCAIALRAEEINALGEQINVKSQSIAGSVYPPARLNYFLFAEDSVGLTAATPMTPAARVSSILTLDADEKGLLFTNQTSMTLHLKLTHLERGVATAVHADAQLWPKYSLSIQRQPGNADSTSTFNAQPALTIPPVDDTYIYRLSSRHGDSDTLSNQKQLTIVLDRVPPLVTDVQVQTRSGILDATTPVTVSWNAQDLNGIARQILEVQIKGETTWRKISDINATDRTATFTWGNLPRKGFSARVTAIDPAGNSGMGSSAPWSPQIFNVAVLTSSVECFYCHMRIEGDVAGINFPPNAVMDQRGDTGENFQILGKLYATNAVPDLFKRQIAAGTMAVSGGFVENYDNASVKVFPSEKDANGIPVFPKLTVDQLKPRVNGTVVNGDGTRYSRIFEGNLTLLGTAQAPIVLNGEFLVTGDLIIKGVYKGIGSVYAKNVYIPDDLRSIDCLPGSNTCPFPFAGVTEDEKIASAKLAIQQKKSALYLAGLRQTVVGGVSLNWGFTLENPYTWYPEAQYRNLCTQGAYLTNSDATRFNTPGQFYDPTSTADIRARCEVSRVDAFLYGHDRITWRAYGNFLINGGFVGYQAALLSTVPYRMFHNGVPARIPVNGRNSMPANQNVIRYDWRLRAGGQGFESLKMLFDQ